MAADTPAAISTFKFIYIKLNHQMNWQKEEKQQDSSIGYMEKESTLLWAMAATSSTPSWRRQVNLLVLVVFFLASLKQPKLHLCLLL